MERPIGTTVRRSLLDGSMAVLKGYNATGQEKGGGGIGRWGVSKNADRGSDKEPVGPVKREVSRCKKIDRHEGNGDEMKRMKSGRGRGLCKGRGILAAEGRI